MSKRVSAIWNASVIGIERAASATSIARPGARRTRAGSTFHASATAATICARSLRQASIVALPTMNVTREE